MTSKDQLQKLFPKAKMVAEKVDGVGIHLPLADGTWLLIAQEDITERERGLLQLFLGELPQEAGHPWARYLQGTGPLPQALSKLQVIHAHIWTVSDEEGKQAWLDMMTKLLPNLQTYYTTNGQDYSFVLDSSSLFDVRAILGDTLATMEFDFGLRMTLFLGQIWPARLLQSWPMLIQAEQSLFQHWRLSHHQSGLLTFSQLHLWAGQIYPIIRRGLGDMIAHQQMEKEIQALWKEGAVLTKAAQSLYIHRNTLQYRLDKWYDWTGLQLKELTDLAVCYQVIMEQDF
ncbi:TPA: helix-turn-helix domain-containing protein [Streptococcus suis]|nr:helix-turn-helix domain-containing protein [Streptococcus suis]HEM4129472.1 helix-turn-helix domain-containing protein [Streptococcus suis]